MSRRLAALLLALLAGPAAAQQFQDLSVSVLYSKGAAAYAANQGKTVEAMVASCANTLSNNYASQLSAPLRVTPFTYPASGGPADSAGGKAMLDYVRYDPKALSNRYTASASTAVIVYDPGNPATPGIAGTVTTNIARDQTGVATIANLCRDFEAVVNRTMGVGPETGYARRIRTYPYEGSNICYHTREAAPSDPNTIVPNYNYWWVQQSPISQAGSPAPSCEAYRVYRQDQEGQGINGPYKRSQIDYLNGPTGEPSCSFWNRVGSGGSMTYGFVPVQYVTGVGGSTIQCGVAGDGAIIQFSSTTGTYLGYPIGDATHNSTSIIESRRVQAMGPGGFVSQNKIMLDASKKGFIESVKQIFK